MYEQSQFLHWYGKQSEEMNLGGYLICELGYSVMPVVETNDKSGISDSRSGWTKEAMQNNIIVGGSTP